MKRYDVRNTLTGSNNGDEAVKVDERTLLTRGPDEEIR
jgi:hypothetical protein